MEARAHCGLEPIAVRAHCGLEPIAGSSPSGRVPGLTRYYPGLRHFSTFRIVAAEPRKQNPEVGIHLKFNILYKTNSNDSMGGWPVSPTPEKGIVEKYKTLLHNALFWEACAKSL